jgi:hypothetical protein
MASNRYPANQGSEHTLEREVLWRANILGGVMGVILADQCAAPLLKQSVLGFAAITLMGALLGWWAGTLVFVLSRRHPILCRTIGTIGTGVVCLGAVLASIFAFYELYIAYSQNNYESLFSASFLGVGALVLCYILRLLNARSTLIGICVCVIILLVGIIYTKDLISSLFGGLWSGSALFTFIFNLKDESVSSSECSQ